MKADMAHSPSAGRILITPRSLTHGGLDSNAELNPLSDAGYELVTATAGATPTEDELQALVPGCVGWLAGVERVSAATIAAASDLRIIARNGVGTDNIDMRAAADAGVTVTTAAGANAQGVAELAVTLALSCLRHVPWSSASLRVGGWDRWPAKEVSEITVGIVGLGAIGRKVAGAFSALGARVLGYDPYSTVEGIDAVSLDELVAASDVVTLHAPPPEDGSALIDTARLALFANGAILVNTARAALVDEKAVLATLEEGRLSAYAVDAFDTEPPELSPMLLHPRVVATPHIGAYTTASVSRATAMAVESLLTNLETR